MTAKTTGKADRVPHDWDAERAVLGGLMQWPEEIEAVSRVLRAEDFHRPANANLYRVVLELAEQGEIDAMLVQTACEDRWPDDPGAYVSSSYVRECMTMAPSAHVVGSHARAVASFASRRRYYEAGKELCRLAKMGAGEADMAERAESIVMEARRPGVIASGPRPLADIARDELGRVIEAFSNPRDYAGIATGFRDLDDLLTIARSDFVIIGARPAVGKTAFMLNLLTNMATRVPSFFASLEMSDGQLVRRLLARATGVSTKAMQTGRMSHKEVERIEEAAIQTLGRLPIWIDDTPGITIGHLRGRVRQLKARCPGLGLVALDYIQLCQGGSNKGNRQEVVSEISRGCKLIAKEFDVALIGLSQLNRGLEKRDEQRPMMSDLRESGSLEQDADAITFLYRDEVYDPGTADRGICEVIVGKQRGGRTGTAKLAWNPARQEFSDLERMPDMWPAREGEYR